MKRKVRVAILGALLHSSAHAAETAVTANPALGKGAVSHSAPSSEKKVKAVRSKKAKPDTKVSAGKTDLKAKVDSVMETPPGSIEQSVQIRGVRG